jgi:hypothetical protein
VALGLKSLLASSEDCSSVDMVLKGASSWLIC